MAGFRVVLLALSSAMLCALLSLGAAASAQAGTIVTHKYKEEGSEQAWLVPAGVESIEVLAIGGKGGDGQESEGGRGERVEDTLHVTPGSTLYVEVGGNGSEEFSGAGSGGTPSDIRSAPRSHGLSPDDRLLVAGAGGGAGAPARPGGESESTRGGEGGDAGGEFGEEGGDGIFAGGGQGGSQTAGGLGGVEFGEGVCAKGVPAEDGARGVGGKGGDCFSTGINGGGGGGGYFGGGGGDAHFSGGGGGGGSSLVPEGGIVGVNESGPPEVEITYTQPPNPPAVVTEPASELRRETVSLNATVNPEGQHVSSCQFEYGPTESYGESVECSTKPGSATLPVAVAASIAGLTFDSTYHYRVVATNVNGTTFGSDETVTTTLHEPPVVTAINPEEGPQAGGETVTISGSEFEEATAVDFGSTAASSFTVNSDESITAVAPAGTGTVGVSVTTPSGTSVGGPHFAFLPPPTVTKVGPEDGPAAGGTTVTITGTNFVAGSGVNFGATPSATVMVKSATSITAVAPPGSGTVDVTVTAPHAGTSAIVGRADRFGYESGAPEFGRCVSATVLMSGLGGFTDRKCSKEIASDLGKFQWEPGVEKGAFTAASKGAVSLETVAKVKVACASAAVSGQVAGASSVSGETIRFKGCALGANACTTSGLASGELSTAVLQGALAWESKAKRKVVLVLSPAGEPFLQYTCAGSAATTITGSILVPVKSGGMLSSYGLKLKGGKGKQKPEAVEGGERHVLSSSVGGGAPEEIGLTLNATQLYEEAVEINPAV